MKGRRRDVRGLWARAWRSNFEWLALAALAGCGARSPLGLLETNGATAPIGGGATTATAGVDASAVAPPDAGVAVIDAAPGAADDGGGRADAGADAATADEIGTIASALQIDPAHDGAIDNPRFAGPLSRLWSASLPAQVSYPLIARGLIVVVTSDGAGSQAQLFAFHARTGALAWGPVGLGAGSVFGAATYEAGRVFSTDGSGMVRAFDLATGDPLWSTFLGGDLGLDTAPTARSGIVYTEGPGPHASAALIAIDEASGRVLWVSEENQTDGSDPAVTADGVFVTHACNQNDRYDPRTGALLWSHAKTGCGGGGGWAPVVAGGLVYARQSDEGFTTESAPFIVDTTSGASVGSFASNPPPAVHAGRAFVVHGGVLGAVDARSIAPAWSFTGDGKLVTPPIVAGGRVFVGSSAGTLFAVDEASGAKVWSDLAGSGFSPLVEGVAHVLTALGAADGLVAAPAGRSLVVYGTRDAGGGD